ncbi:ABC-2 type transport system permease protein [Streptomyces sp. PanSC19]|uniref:ABC transporter permease n=1 Tax=Streptomyces sp. PanSC19 TaxID=1520455 RepID=UPI000F4A46A0|nr:ABC transporter permease [Streptomyces sp. PanSC19]ROQ33271.1 ABC-2 type transport system permease protein [Streptomyces sp. PanSC19]
MSAPTTQSTHTPTAGRTSNPLTRIAALGRAELTLLGRNRNNLFVAAVMPLLMIFLLRSSLKNVDEATLGLSPGAATLIGGTGTVLLLVVYMSLTSSLVARREELVLKRLRTGEATDAEILTGAALPATAIALAQCAILTVGGSTLLGSDAPARPDLLVLGLVAAIALLAGLAAVTTTVTRTVESAGLTTLPLFLVSSFGSGLFVPHDALPELAADLALLLPLSGAMEFVRAGWLGTAHAGSLLTAALNTVAWGVLTGWAARRWFRWEPRR